MSRLRTEKSGPLPGPVSAAKLAALPERDPAVTARNVELLRKMDGRMPYMANLGWTLLEAEYGFLRFRLPCSEASTGADGSISSGALLSAVDHAGSVAAWMTRELGSPRLFGSTVNSKLAVLRPCPGRALLVEARAVGSEGELVHSRVDILSEDGELVAQGSTIYRIVERTR